MVKGVERFLYNRSKGVGLKFREAENKMIKADKIINSTEKINCMLLS